jgi:hypothetical protein
MGEVESTTAVFLQAPNRANLLEEMTCIFIDSLCTT